MDLLADRRERILCPVATDRGPLGWFSNYQASDTWPSCLAVIFLFQFQNNVFFWSQTPCLQLPFLSAAMVASKIIDEVGSIDPSVPAADASIGNVHIWEHFISIYIWLTLCAADGFENTPWWVKPMYFFFEDASFCSNSSTRPTARLMRSTVKTGI